jgi:peptidoglycan/LPS O-acetylase OafA/YrhL
MNYLTSLRGIAALIVIFFHAHHHFPSDDPKLLTWIIYNGFLAVDFFFIMSGFILAYTYSKKFTRFTSQDYRSFMLKRFARIYPLHFFILVLYISIPLILYLTGRDIGGGRYDIDAFFAKLFLIDVWWTGYQFTWNIPSWTISSELFAYLLFPFIVIPFSRIGKPLIIPVALCIPMMLAFLYDHFEYGSIGEGIGDLGVIRGLLEFSLGMSVYYIVIKYQLTNTVVARSAVIVSVLLFYLCVTFDVQDFIYVPICFSMFLYGLLGYKGLLHKFLENRAMVYLGDISYSVYLSHFFILDIMTKAFLKNDEIAGPVWMTSYVLVTLFFSALSYHFVEMSSRRWIVKKWA